MAAKGTILFKIEKVSEFARDDWVINRFSEAVYIRGIPWKIWTYSKPAFAHNYLAFYLQCNGENIGGQGWQQPYVQVGAATQQQPPFVHFGPAHNRHRNARTPTPRSEPQINPWGRCHAQLTIVEPATVIDGTHSRATPHTAIAKFAEKPYFKVLIRQRSG
ncbi:hypothetical protein GPALN_009769 [Globodera pallida]|nr:hypothetical protein GPALN_009769 [Globodera pallida]